ncbi:MAG: hypothetical protein Q8N51_00650 [Gammaproteobacteria bacterium]|nr:hypothetical protein [Gammaproteobacteria bacterium]
MHTEAEAKQLWCPMARAAHPDAGDAGLCLASGCAAWRYADGAHPRARFAQHDDYEAEAEPGRPDGVPTDWRWIPRSESDSQDYPGWVEPYSAAVARRRGYCGLAGKP